MSSRNTIVIVCMCVCLGLVGIAFHGARKRIELSTLIAANEVTKRQLQAELQELEKARAMVARAESPRPTVKADQAPAASVPAKSQTRDMQSLIDQDPALANLYIRSKRAELDQSYGALFQALGLSDNQIEKFKDIKAEQFARFLDTVAAFKTVRQNGVKDPLGAEIDGRLREQARSENLALLGERGFERLQEYERTLPVRSMVAQFAGLLSSIEPLAAQQADQLIQLTAGASERYRAGGKADWMDIDWGALDRDAQRILTPRQFILWQSAEPLGGGPSRWMASLWQTTNGPKAGSK